MSLIYANVAQRQRPEATAGKKTRQRKQKKKKQEPSKQEDARIKTDVPPTQGALKPTSECSRGHHETSTAPFHASPPPLHPPSPAHTISNEATAVAVPAQTSFMMKEKTRERTTQLKIVDRCGLAATAVSYELKTGIEPGVIYQFRIAAANRSDRYRSI